MTIDPEGNIRPEHWSSYPVTISDLCEAYPKAVGAFVNIKVQGSNIIDRLYANHMPAPFQRSLLTIVLPGQLQCVGLATIPTIFRAWALAP